MKNNTLVSLRSNCVFALDYQSGKLIPQTEVILITTNPKYVLNKTMDAFRKEQEITEYRFHCDLEGVNKLIGELQLLVKNMNNFEQTSAAFNAIIESQKENKQ